LARSKPADVGPTLRSRVADYIAAPRALRWRTPPLLNLSVAWSSNRSASNLFPDLLARQAMFAFRACGPAANFPCYPRIIGITRLGPEWLRHRSVTEPLRTNGKKTPKILEIVETPREACDVTKIT
jgi:hypothetical protein